MLNYLEASDQVKAVDYYTTYSIKIKIQPLYIEVLYIYNIFFYHVNGIP